MDITKEIIAYDVSTSPTLHQTFNMLNKLCRHGSLEGMILHSDQGWQYQHSAYQSFLKDHGIIQSMSRKGNSLDNGMMENFFSVMKREMCYGYENLYKSASDLIQTIHQYIHYYNNDRIKVKLKGTKSCSVQNSVPCCLINKVSKIWGSLHFYVIFILFFLFFALTQPISKAKWNHIFRSVFNSFDIFPVTNENKNRQDNCHADQGPDRQRKMKRW